MKQIYHAIPGAGDVLIWYQHNQSTKCYAFLVKNPSEGDLQPISKRQFQSLKMANEDLATYYDKCYK